MNHYIILSQLMWQSDRKKDLSVLTVICLTIYIELEEIHSNCWMIVHVIIYNKNVMAQATNFCLVHILNLFIYLESQDTVCNPFLLCSIFIGFRHQFTKFVSLISKCISSISKCWFLKIYAAQGVTQQQSSSELWIHQLQRAEYGEEDEAVWRLAQRESEQPFLAVARRREEN